MVKRVSRTLRVTTYIETVRDLATCQPRHQRVSGDLRHSSIQRAGQQTLVTASALATNWGRFRKTQLRRPGPAESTQIMRRPSHFPHGLVDMTVGVMSPQSHRITETSVAPRLSLIQILKLGFGCVMHRGIDFGCGQNSTVSIRLIKTRGMPIDDCWQNAD